MIKSYKAVIFDLDGTLIDSAKDLQYAVNEVFSKRNWQQLSEEKIGSFIGNGVGHLLNCCLQEINLQLADSELEQVLTEVKQGYHKHCLNSTKAYDGVATTLATLQQLGYVMAVCTNKPEDISNKILAGLGLAKYFATVVGGDRLEVRKPHPSVMQAVLDDLQITKEMAVYVGDSMTDIQLVANFDMPTFIVNTGYQNQPLDNTSSADASQVVDIRQVSDILGLLVSNIAMTTDKVQALLFDVDGTLALNEDLHLAGFNHAFQEHSVGWNWDKELYAKLLKTTGGKERIKYYQDNFAVAKKLSTDEIKAVHECKNDFYHELVRSGKLQTRFGIKRLMGECRQKNIKMAVVTTTSRTNAEVLLSMLLGKDALNWFETIVCGEDVINKKPAADAYVYAINKLNIAPQNCLAVEDSANGYKSAKAANIKSIITVNEYTKNDDFLDADFMVSSLGDDVVKTEVIKYSPNDGNIVNELGYIDLHTLEDYVCYHNSKI